MDDQEFMVADDSLETIMLQDEDGKETEYFIIDEVEYNGAKYLLVVEAAEAEDDEAEAVLFKQVEEDGEEVVYERLMDDEEFEKVVEILTERLDEYDIEY